jgi:hypothetical protein
MRLPFLIAILAALVVSTGCKKKPQAEIVLREAAVSAWDDKVSVGTQIQLVNTGNHSANDVRVTRVEVEGGSYTGPITLPTGSLGDLNAGSYQLPTVRCNPEAGSS